MHKGTHPIWCVHAVGLNVVLNIVARYGCGRCWMDTDTYRLGEWVVCGWCVCVGIHSFQMNRYGYMYVLCILWVDGWMNGWMDG